MSLQIVHYSDPILRRKGDKVTAFDASLARFASEMLATMHAAGGIGLAAQQVGRAVQLCVIDLRRAEADFNWELDGVKLPLDLWMPTTIANPELRVVRGTDEYLDEEGCLSFPKSGATSPGPTKSASRFRMSTASRTCCAAMDCSRDASSTRRII